MLKQRRFKGALNTTVNPDVFSKMQLSSAMAQALREGYFSQCILGKAGTGRSIVMLPRDVFLQKVLEKPNQSIGDRDE